MAMLPAYRAIQATAPALVEPSPARPLTVLHSFPNWLPLTQVWLYNQVQFLPLHVRTHIVCERTSHLDLFALPNLHVWGREPFWERQIDHARRRLHVTRHLRFYERVATDRAAQLLHSHFGHVGWHDLGVGRRANLRHVVSFYGQDVGRLPTVDPRWHTRYREMFARVSAVLCEGPFMRERVIELGCPAHKARVHHLGVDTRSIQYRPRTWQRDGPLRILIAASFREKKGVPDALRAIAMLHGLVDFSITIIGDAGEDEPSRLEKARILRTIADCGLGAKVRLLGYQPYRALMSEAYQHHIFIHPSKTAGDGDTEGGAPMSLSDMAASGAVIVATRHCDIPEVIRDGAAGLLAEEGDVAELGAHLQQLANAPSTWRVLTQRARRHVEREFDATVQAGRLARLYAEICSEQSATPHLIAKAAGPRSIGLS